MMMPSEAREQSLPGRLHYARLRLLLIPLYGLSRLLLCLCGRCLLVPPVHRGFFHLDNVVLRMLVQQLPTTPTQHEVFDDFWPRHLDS
jgi:hypothetical protein